jgi:hypothetical protein
MSRSAFSFHFTHPQQAQDFFQQAGFKNITVVQPKQYFQDHPMNESPSDEHFGDLVWMIHASIKKQR